MIQRRQIIVVVAADRAVQESLKFLLEFDGFNVHLCESGDDLVKSPVLPHAQCLVLDYEMPHANGIELVWHLKAQKILIPTILMTNHATDKIHRQAIMAGIKYVLEKPFFEGMLAAYIKEIQTQMP